MEAFEEALSLWDEARALIQEGYQRLNKRVVLGLPATCMPPESKEKDTGIGSPYSEGAGRVWRFWHGVIQNIMIGPIGKTYSDTWHSPYASDWNYNPFLIDLEALYKKGFIRRATLNKIYRAPKKDGYIDFNTVEPLYREAIEEARKTAKSPLDFTCFCNQIVRHQLTRAPFTYIGDIPVNIAPQVYNRHPDWFLKDWSVGAPPDFYSPEPQVWGFPVLKPEKLFTGNPEHPLGPAGRVLKQLLRFYFSGNKGGIRIDHFIGWVNPYCFYTGTKKQAHGRLYSSPKHPVLKEYYLKNKADFKRQTELVLMPLLKEFGLTTDDIYPEDLGIRPPELDPVLKAFHLGRMLPAQFNEPEDEDHMYHLAHANKNDIAVLDTHDNPSLMDFFKSLPYAKRKAFAKQLAEDLRFDYTEDLTTPEWLYRMQWAAALASPAERMMVFFTTLMGQEGRYNTPGTLDSWHLRCKADFDLEYFKALKTGMAYNPFEAISWAIYARGETFYNQNKDFVQKLRDMEQVFFNALKAL